MSFAMAWFGGSPFQLLTFSPSQDTIQTARIDIVANPNPIIVCFKKKPWCSWPNILCSNGVAGESLSKRCLFSQLSWANPFQKGQSEWQITTFYVFLKYFSTSICWKESHLQKPGVRNRLFWQVFFRPPSHYPLTSVQALILHLSNVCSFEASTWLVWDRGLSECTFQWLNDSLDNPASKDITNMFSTIRTPEIFHKKSGHRCTETTQDGFRSSLPMWTGLTPEFTCAHWRRPVLVFETITVVTVTVEFGSYAPSLALWVNNHPSNHNQDAENRLEVGGSHLETSPAWMSET